MALDVDDGEDEVRSPDDAQRTAEIETLWERREPIAGMAAEKYLASRGLTAPCDSLGWLPNMRAGEGALIAAVTDPNKKLVAVQLTYLQPDGVQIAVQAATSDVARAARLGDARRRMALAI